MLGLSIDTLDELDDELLAENRGMKFIAEEGFSIQYGGEFSIAMVEGVPALTADTLPKLGQAETCQLG